MKRPSLKAVFVCALIAVSVAGATKIAVSSAGAAAGVAQPQSFALLEVNTMFVGAAGFDGTAPPKVGQGFVIASDYYNWHGTKRGDHVGTLNATCTFLTDPMKASGKTVCTAVASLKGGKITAVGLTGNDQFMIPIAGGTGTYVGVKGFVDVTNSIGGKDTNKSIDRFVFTP